MNKGVQPNLGKSALLAIQTGPTLVSVVGYILAAAAAIVGSLATLFGVLLTQRNRCPGRCDGPLRPAVGKEGLLDVDAIGCYRRGLHVARLRGEAMVG